MRQTLYFQDKVFGPEFPGSGLGEITGYMAGDGAAKIVVKNKKDFDRVFKEGKGGISRKHAFNIS